LSASTSVFTSRSLPPPLLFPPLPPVFDYPNARSQFIAAGRWARERREYRTGPTVPALRSPNKQSSQSPRNPLGRISSSAAALRCVASTTYYLPPTLPTLDQTAAIHPSLVTVAPRSTLHHSVDTFTARHHPIPKLATAYIQSHLSEQRTKLARASTVVAFSQHVRASPARPLPKSIHEL
jgi:hypothetical protein